MCRLDNTTQLVDHPGKHVRSILENVRLLTLSIFSIGGRVKASWMQSYDHLSVRKWALNLCEMIIYKVSESGKNPVDMSRIIQSSNEKVASWSVLVNFTKCPSILKPRRFLRTRFWKRFFHHWVTSCFMPVACFVVFLPFGNV